LSTLVSRHNDPEDGYHIGLHNVCVIGHQNEDAFDVLRMNISSLWMLTHAFRAIKAGWGFQLTADVTGKLCRKIDLLAFSVTSIPKLKSQECKECILPVQTAMCDNSKGWGNFAENVLGIKSYVCLLHATGNVQLFCAVACNR
jgi:hypothetical protein